jgi:hypothetical protein
MSDDERKLPKVRDYHKPSTGPSSDPEWGQALPVTRVLSPVVSTLDALHDATQVAVDKVRLMLEASTEVDPATAKTLLALAQTVASVQASKKAAREDDDELEKMSEEELDTALERALQERRAKRLGRGQ